MEQATRARLKRRLKREKRQREAWKRAERLDGTPVVEHRAEREAWLKLSESALMKTWDNADDDVFNELLTK